MIVAAASAAPAFAAAGSGEFGNDLLQVTINAVQPTRLLLQNLANRALHRWM